MIRFKSSGTIIPSTEVLKNAVVLADIIKQEYIDQESGFPRLVFLARSSWHIGPILLRELNISPSEALNINAERVSSDPSIDIRQRYKLGQLPTKSLVRGKNLLIVDAACRTGETLLYASQQLTKLQPSSIKTAVIYDSAPAIGDQKVCTPDLCAVRDIRLGYITTRWEFEEMFTAEEEPIATESNQPN